jgi:hypothetical protein
MVNLVLHITLPAGLGLTNGSSLQCPVTFDIVSAISPFYASVSQVKLMGGPLLRKLQDITIASQIYDSSKQADLFNMCPPISGDRYVLYTGARNQWVQSDAARDLLLSATELLGNPGSHILANFTVARQKGYESEGTPEKLKELKEQLKIYEVTIRSGGRTVPGGHAKSRMAAKGVFDWEERAPSRTWITTGMGANSQTIDGGSPTGGRGKPVKFYASPLFMGPMSGYRFGIFQSSSPLNTVYPSFSTAALPTPMM